MRHTDAFLRDLAPRHPHERVRRAVEVARGMGTADRRALLADLGGREPYCRHLAVTMAAATREVDHLLAALRDPYPGVRARALGASGLPDDALAALVEDAPLNDRLALYARLRRRRQAALADRLLAAVHRRWGEAEAARLLAACSGPVVTEALPVLGHAVRSWTLLAVHHLDAVVGYATTQLAALDGEARTGWWERTAPLQRALALHQPAALLELCERFLSGPVPSAVLTQLGRLLAVDPARVARLMLADPPRAGRLGRWRITRSVRDRLATLPAPDLGALLRASGPAPGLVATVLRSLPPARREAIFDLAYAGRDLAAQVLPEEILTVLPHERRHAEARRMLTLPVVATDASARLRATAFLPYPEAAAELDKATRSAEPDERALAYQLLVRCAARTGDPEAVGALLAGLDRIRNEQDPVRSRLLAALAEVRPDLFPVAAAGPLDGLVRDALDARDCSWQTSGAVVRLVMRVLWQSAASGEAQPLTLWALESIERIGAWQQAPVTADLSRVLRRGQEHAVFDRLRDRLAGALRRNDAWPLLAFARSLGRRAWHLPQLQELLGQAAQVKDDAMARSAVSLWLRPPRGRTEKVTRLVAYDRSMLTLPDVLAVVARRRTDLVDRDLLAGRRLRGRFGTGEAWWLPAVDRTALTWWTPHQVERYAALVLRAVHDQGLDRRRRAALARVAAGLPGHGPAAVADLVAGDDVLVAEGALTGLSHCDRPDQALPVLLESVHGDRARVAVFAASRCARSTPPSRLAAVLGHALAQAPKVTVRKEAARLLSALRPPGAVEELVAAWHRDGQHRDVRVAVAAALRARLDDPRSWAVLEAAVEGERHAAGSLLDATPFQLAEPDRARYAVLVSRLTGHPEPEVVRRAYAALAAWTPWAPQSGARIAAGVTDLAQGPTWRYAADCALAPAVWQALPDLLPQLATTLLRLARSDPDAEPLRDLPARQRLGHLVEGVCRAAEAARRQPAPARRMVEVLAAEPTFATAAARLSAALLWPGPGFVDDVQALAGLLAALPAAASEVDRYPVVYKWVSRWEPADIAPGVDALAGRGDGAGGLLAVVLAKVAGPRAGWPQEWRQRLRMLRRHPVPEVRHAALAVFTAIE
ncbi:MAG TPA: hypothetical protein VFM55_25800 [Micromonosporaceae bacterium]|nr:hypothetical protein [Micromonosporaceae bacterium]